MSMLTCRKFAINNFFRKFNRIRFYSWNDDKNDLLFQSSFQLCTTGTDDIGKDPFSISTTKNMTVSTSTSDSAINTISPEVIHSMIKAGFDKEDYETVQLVINEAKLLGKLSVEILEKSIIEYLQMKDYKHTMILFLICIDNNYILKNIISKTFHAQLITNCYWNDAVVIAEYMIKNNHQFRNLDIFFLVNGLLNNSSTDGISKALKLIQLISEYRRNDLSSNFDFSKVSKNVYVYTTNILKQNISRSNI